MYVRSLSEPVYDPTCVSVQHLGVLEEIVAPHGLVPIGGDFLASDIRHRAGG